MEKFLVSSGLCLLFLSLLVAPAMAGSEGVENPDSSSSAGDTFGPDIIGLIERFIGPIRGASASVNGNTITVSIPSQQIQAVFVRANGAVQLQVNKYSKDDVESLKLLADGKSLNEVLEKAIATLQRVDPARAARIQALLERLNTLVTALNNQSSNLPSKRLLVAATLDALVAELRENAETLSSQPVYLAEANSSSSPKVIYESPVAGAVVNAVQEHNNTVQSLPNSDAVALAKNTNFVVVADILEQIAGELRGNPIPQENLAPINKIIATLSSK